MKPWIAFVRNGLLVSPVALKMSMPGGEKDLEKKGGREGDEMGLDERQEVGV